MESDATGTTRAQALTAALAALSETHERELEAIKAALADGTLTAAEAEDRKSAALSVYERECDLADLAAVTGWHTWVGVGGILYARRPRSSPPMVVRAATPEALAEAIERAKTPRGR